MNDDSDLFFDEDLDAAIIEQLEQPQQAEDEEFDDDDVDMNQLVEVAASIEQQHAATKSISFLSDTEDPSPPPPLSESTPCFHPFDAESLRIWIYPTNYPVRAYQLNIVQKAMFQNTLVALPTGLGKTFIAAVVMFNYYRWFPNSKVIFMAPTRPLVTQQIEACFSICGLPQNDTTEMMGTTTPAKRRELWKSKRVFFATPQTVQKDLDTNSCPAEKISCIVVDEAHRATGNFAYTEVVRKLYKKNQAFRILALTATPGSSLDTVQDVVDHLHITNIQIRTEDSMDIREFSFGKRVERRIVRLDYTEGSTGMLPRVIADYRAKVLLPLLEELSRKPTSVVASVDRASPFGLRAARMHFQATCKNLNNSLKYAVVSLFLVTEAASRAHDLLCQHGIVPFLESVESTLQEYKAKLDDGGKLSRSQLAFYNHPVLNAIVRDAKIKAANPEFIGHPKLEQLASVLLNHFTGLEGPSKVMVFSSYRSSVVDIVQVLNRHQPILRCSMFVGQASDKAGMKGLKQSEQQDVIQKFKRNEFNVLVSTSIGEEGLDIGELDLIVCFDSQTSPIRMLQRMGRTGRKRQGKCILLLTESEEKKFSQAKETYERIQRLIARGGMIRYYGPNPTILPANYKPTICRKKIDVGVYQTPTSSKKRKRGTLAATLSDYTPEGLLKPYVESGFLRSLGPYESMKQAREQLWPLRPTGTSVNKYMPLQARLQTPFRVGHSRRTTHFVRLVEKIEHQIMYPDGSPPSRVLSTSHVSDLPVVGSRLVLPPKAKPRQHPSESSVGSRLVLPPKVIKPRRPEEDPQHHEEEPQHHEEIPQHNEEPAKKDKGKQRMTEEDDFDPNFGLENTPSWEPMLSDNMFDDDDFGDFPDDFYADALVMTTTTTKAFNDNALDPMFPFEQTPLNDGDRRIGVVWAQESPVFAGEVLKELERRQERFKAVHGNYVAMTCVKKFSQPFVPAPEGNKNRGSRPSVKSPSVSIPPCPISEDEGSFGLNSGDSSPALNSLDLNKDDSSPALDSLGLNKDNSSPSLGSLGLNKGNSSPALNSLGLDPDSDLDNELPGFVGDASFEKNSPVLIDDDVNLDQLDLEFSEDVFANFLENKFSQDEAHDFPTFLFDDHEPKQQSQYIMKKSALYAEDIMPKTKASKNSKPKANSSEEPIPLEEEEPIFVFDFDQMSGGFDEEDDVSVPLVIEESDEKRKVDDGSVDDSHHKEHGDPLDNRAVSEKSDSHIIESDDEVLEKSKDDKAIPEGILIESSDDEIGHCASNTHAPKHSSITIDSSEDEEPITQKRTPSLTTTPNINQQKTASPLRSERREDSESPLVVHRRARKKRIISEEDQGSPLSLLSLSKGLYSPLRAGSDDNESLAARKITKKRTVIELEDEEVPVLESASRKKRLKQKLSSDSLFEDDDEFEIPRTSRNTFLSRLQQSGYEYPPADDEGGNQNIFIDDEAEKSEDGGHTEEEDVCEGSSLMNSFIDDNSSVDPSSRISNDNESRGNVYALMDSQPLNDRHWMNKFNADKWLNDTHDQEVVTEDDEEEIESIHDFSSAIEHPAAHIIIGDDDDDFM